MAESNHCHLLSGRIPPTTQQQQSKRLRAEKARWKLTPTDELQLHLTRRGLTPGTKSPPQRTSSHQLAHPHLDELKNTTYDKGEHGRHTGLEDSTTTRRVKR